MSISDWEGIALIIGTGEIGNSITDYLISKAPKLDFILCGRNFNNQSGIYLDFENDVTFNSFEKQISLFDKHFV